MNYLQISCLRNSRNKKTKNKKNPVTIEEVSKAALIIFVITPDISVYAISKFVCIYIYVLIIIHH